MGILDGLKLKRKSMKKKIVKFRKYEELEGQIIQDNYTNHFTPFSHYDFYAAGVLETEILPEIEPTTPGIYEVIVKNHDAALLEKKLLIEPNVGNINKNSIKDKIQIFLNRHDFFTKKGLIPKRGILLHGVPGCGKTHCVNHTVSELRGENGLVIYFSMDNLDIYMLNSVLKRIDYTNIDKLFLVIEDLGGAEMTDGMTNSFLPSSSDLLSLLDGNSLENKTLPTVILSTTNYPKNLLENLLDRPGRFDEVLEFGLPSGDESLVYAETLYDNLTDFDRKSIKDGGVSLAHIKEAIVRKEVYDVPIYTTLDDMRKNSKKVKADIASKTV